MRWSAGACFQSTPDLSIARTISCPAMISGDFFTSTAKPGPDLDGLILLLESSACQRGSGGAVGAATFAAAFTSVCAPAATAAPSAGSFGHGAGPSTSLVSNLMTSTG